MYYKAPSIAAAPLCLLFALFSIMLMLPFCVVVVPVALIKYVDYVVACFDPALTRHFSIDDQTLESLGYGPF
jgi:hypothetical protein